MDVRVITIQAQVPGIIPERAARFVMGVTKRVIFCPFYSRKYTANRPVTDMVTMYGKAMMTMRM
jgi:hypothetical protein